MNQLYNPDIMNGLWAFFAMQVARVHTNLYPYDTCPRHVRGPRKPDMAEQESIDWGR